MYANACRGAEEARERQIPFLPCRWSVKNAANRIGHPTRKVDHRGYIRKSYKVATTHTSTCLVPKQYPESVYLWTLTHNDVGILCVAIAYSCIELQHHHQN